MTNTEQSMLNQASSGSEQSQEDVQLTELLPVEQSRIKDSNDRDDAATDGLKVLRSFTQDEHENLNAQNLFDKNKLNQLIIHNNNNDNINNNSRSRNKNRCGKKLISDNDKSLIDDNKIKNKMLKVNGDKLKDGDDILNDEIYYYQQQETAEKGIDENGNDEEEKEKVEEEDINMNNLTESVIKGISNNFIKKPEESNELFINTSTLSSDNNINTLQGDIDSDETDNDDLRLKIDVIIQSDYLLEMENNSNGESSKEKQQTNSKVNNNSNSNNYNVKEQLKSEGKNIDDTKKYNCLMCDAKFKGSGGLRNHWKVVHGTGPFYKCDDCGKEFPLKERLKLHVRTHTGFKPYKCPDCDKSFARGGQLAQHRRTHTHIKPYHCTLCSGTFTCAANLSLHMKRHNGQKDHKCEICGRGFIRRDALKKHLECLHKDVKSFLCVICNKTFKGHLPQHMRTHCQDRPHGCATCGQRFAQKSQLTVHQRIHSGQRPFRCLVCWQAFAHSTALKLHTRRHTGERPFKCNECNAGFTQLPHWKKHMKCIHGRTEPYSCKNCNQFFRIKNDLENHEKTCLVNDTNNVDESSNGAGESSSSSTTSSSSLSTATSKSNNVDPFRIMTIEKMRFLLAVLLKRISKPERLEELGFGKRLIDEVLRDCLESAGKDSVKIGQLNELETLRRNLETFLKWTVPKEHWETFKKLNKRPEEILETLTAS